MIVYRYMCKDEYDNIMKLDFEKVGGVYASKGLSNTFKYKKGERYLHFFKNIDDMEVIRKLYLKDGKDYYYCSFDIPIFKLIKSMGTGYYEPSGYDFDYISKREYAILVKEFNPKWLQDAILDEEKHKLNEESKKLDNQNLEPNL